MKKTKERLHEANGQQLNINYKLPKLLSCLGLSIAPIGVNSSTFIFFKSTPFQLALFILTLFVRLIDKFVLIALNFDIITLF